MTLRDAEAIVLEAGKIPTLRRRGAVEALSMGAIEPQLIAEFAAPLVDGKDPPVTVVFEDPDGGSFQCTFDKAPAGLRLTARVARKNAGAAAAAPKSAWWSKKPGSPAPAPSSPPAAPTTATTTAAPATITPPTPVAAVAPPASATNPEALARLAQLLVEPVFLASQRGASDVIVSTGQPPRVRLDGRVEPLDCAIDDAELAAIVALLGSNTDHGLEIEGTRLRVNLFDHLGGYAIAARLIRERVPSLAELALPAELGHVVDYRDGLVLVCGPTGCGKSTTLAALLDVLDQRRAAHVITLEDPIEYRFSPRRCLIHQRELGRHVPSFAAGLKSALREAPDVILLGELRDKDTIAAALTAAETGHLVLATLHAPNAVGAIDRMIDAFTDAQQRQIRWQLAAVLRTVITQFLLPRRDGGRAPAYEVVPVTGAVCNIIRKGDLHTLPTAIQSGRDAGMIPLERSLARLIDSGTVSPQVVRKIAADHDLLAALSGKLR